MARERFVTRTVKVAVCTTLCMNVTTAEVIEKDYLIGGGISEEKDLLKAIKKLYETTTHKTVAIKSVKFTETIYGMPEAEFIAKARILDPETRKVIETI